MELFEEMELGDCWPDAHLKECFDYLINCKYTRTKCIYVHIVELIEILVHLGSSGFDGAHT